MYNPNNEYQVIQPKKILTEIIISMYCNVAIYHPTIGFVEAL